MLIVEQRFSERTALVTGAGGGIGSAVVNALLEEGATVLGLDCSSQKLAALSAGLRRHGASFSGVVGDVTATAEVEAAFGRVQSLDMLVTCAGYYSSGPTELVSLEEWQRNLDVNLKGAFICCRAAARMMLARGSGAIVALSASCGTSGEAEHAAYAASEGAITAFAKSLAHELGPVGIRVNCVVPGAIESPLHRAMADGEGAASSSLSDNPLRQAGQPRDVANLVLFLLSDASRHITGQVVHCNGGSLMP